MNESVRQNSGKKFVRAIIAVLQGYQHSFSSLSHQTLIVFKNVLTGLRIYFAMSTANYVEPFLFVGA